MGGRRLEKAELESIRVAYREGKISKAEAMAEMSGKKPAPETIPIEP